MNIMDNSPLNTIEIDKSRILELKKNLHSSGLNALGEEVFHGEDSDWILFTIRSMYFRMDIEVMAQTPLPSKNTLIDTLFVGDTHNEVAGAALLLFHLESTIKMDFRELVMDRLESIKVRQMNKKTLIRWELITYTLELDNPLNRRETLRKSNQEITEDSEYFSNISTRAYFLIKKLNFRRKFRFLMFK